jgi:hypothetical protein
LKPVNGTGSGEDSTPVGCGLRPHRFCPHWQSPQPLQPVLSGICPKPKDTPPRSNRKKLLTGVRYLDRPRSVSYAPLYLLELLYFHAHTHTRTHARTHRHTRPRPGSGELPTKNLNTVPPQVSRFSVSVPLLQIFNLVGNSYRPFCVLIPYFILFIFPFLGAIWTYPPSPQAIGGLNIHCNLVFTPVCLL